MKNKEKDVKNCTIEFLVREMKRNHICLPSFQRDFVWKPKQMALLIESIVRHYPIGTFIFLRYLENRDLGKNSFVRTDPNAFRPLYYVIDGQQRLRTFLQLLSKPDKFRPHESIESEGKKYKIYLDISTKISNLPEDVDVPTFVRPYKTEEDSKEDYEWQGENELMPIELVLDKKYIQKWFKAAFTKGGKNKKLRKYKQNIIDIRKRILSYECPVEYIVRKLSPKDHTNIFRLLNEAGTDLTTFDLLNAQLNCLHINLRELWKNAVRDYNIFELYEIDPIYILKVLLLIRQTRNEKDNPTCTQRDLKHIYKIYQIDSIYMKYKLGGETEREFRIQFNEDWKEACKYTANALNEIQRNFGACQKKYIPYTPMIIVLSAIAGWMSRYSQRYKGTMREKIRKWYWGAIFYRSYEQATDTVVSTHYKWLRQWLSPVNSRKTPKEINFKLHKSGIREQIEDIESSGDARYKAILCLPLVNNAQDIYSHEFLSQNLHDHHIYPKRSEEMLNCNVGEVLLNNIVNRMLITDKTNQEIKNRSPGDYLAETCCSRSNLKKHFLFKEIVTKKLAYQIFCKKRKRLIINRLYGLINR